MPAEICGSTCVVLFERFGTRTRQHRQSTAHMGVAASQVLLPLCWQSHCAQCGNKNKSERGEAPLVRLEQMKKEEQEKTGKKIERAILNRKERKSRNKGKEYCHYNVSQPVFLMPA